MNMKWSSANAPLRNEFKARVYAMGRTLSDVVREMNGRGYPTLRLNTFTRYLGGWQTAYGNEVIAVARKIVDEWENEQGVRA